MRQIKKKNDGGPKLSEENKKPPVTSAEARDRWRAFLGKSLLSSNLELDQFGLCVYTELSPNHFGLNSHIEHVVPKSLVPNLTFEYYNLAFCSLSSNDLQTIVPDHFGGHFKGNSYDENLFISSVTEDSSVFFLYSSSGRVIPEPSLTIGDEQRAVYTIKLLNLNSPFLVSKRREWMENLMSFIDIVIDDPERLRNMACDVLLPSNSKLTSFFSATKQTLGPVAEEILINNAEVFR